MPPYRANLGGAFGSGRDIRGGSGNIDIASAIREVGNQASSLIQSAYLRKIAEVERAKQANAEAMLRADKQAALTLDAQRRAEDVAFRKEQLQLQRDRLAPKPAAPHITPGGQVIRTSPTGDLVATDIPGFRGEGGKGVYEERKEGGGTAIYEGGRFTRWKIPPPETAPTRAQLPTEGERKAAAFYKSGEYGYTALERIIAGDDPATPQVETGKPKPVPGFFASARQRIGMGVGNVMTNDQVRQMRQAGLMLSDAWLRYTSGAAVPEQEVERFRDSFLPQPGDDPGTLALKSGARKVIIDAIRSGASRALDKAEDADYLKGLEAVRKVSPEAAALMMKYRPSVGTQPSPEEMVQRTPDRFGPRPPGLDPNDPD